MIDPGELALANIGLSNVIKGDVPEVGVRRMGEMARVQAQIPELAAQAVAGKLKLGAMPRPSSYRELLVRLARPMEPAEIMKLSERFGEQASEVSGPFLVQVQRAFKYIADILPVSEFVTFAGPQKLTPSGDRVWRFFNVLWVLDDPLRVFELMSTGALLRSQRDAVKMFFPTLAKAIDDALYVAIGEAAALAAVEHEERQTNTAGRRIPPRAEAGIATWLRRKLAHAMPPAPSGPRPAPAPRKRPSNLPNLQLSPAQTAEGSRAAAQPVGPTQ